jgi:thiol-disulfide isomerase/thioredoxin
MNRNPDTPSARPTNRVSTGLSKLRGVVAAAAIALTACQGAETPAATDGIPGQPGVSFAESLKQIQAVQAAREAYSNEANEARKEALWQAYTQTNDATVPRVLETVRQAPGTPNAFNLLAWVVTNPRVQVKALRPCGWQAVAWLRDYHTTNPKIGPVCQQLGWNWDPLHPPAREFLARAATNNPDRTARGQANFVLARLAKQMAEGLASLELSTNAADREALAALRKAAASPDAQTAFANAEKQFEMVANKYRNCANFPAGPGLRHPQPTLGEEAELEWYELRHLEVGKQAPEIVGKDLDGWTLKLSEFRGQVVVLSFWASWCGPCMQMVPHERELAKRLKGKPFALVGVNGDDSPAAAKKAVTKEQITWKSFANGDAWTGAIAKAWNVHGWPAVYVLDPQGIIRLKLDGYGGKRTDAQLDAVVDRLLAEMPPVKP